MSQYVVCVAVALGSPGVQCSCFSTGKECAVILGTQPHPDRVEMGGDAVNEVI